MKKFLLSLFVLLLTASAVSFGQAISQNGGSIQGTITDPTGAIVSGATIVISDPATGYTHTLTSDKSGYYSLGPLTPGEYVITVTAPSFEKLAVKTVVRVGTVTSGNEKLTVGSAAETVEVNAGAIQVNTEQIGVAGIVTKEQIDTLPINGRNILDIAQVQPGVVLQSGQSFDPTKAGYSALAVNGINGRSTRVLFDGQDISDETVGTVVYNVPEGAVGELQLNRSTQDVSGSVTSTGQVLLASQSGTNAYHGTLFYNFQDNHAGFANVAGKSAIFQRNQFGGYVGGAIIKDKLFFFGGVERIKQADLSPVGSSSLFSAIVTKYPQLKDPFKDTFSIGRLDYNAPWGVHLFARATYSNNFAYGTAGEGAYAVYQNQDNVPAIVGGADFTTGRFTHSIRFGYLKFINNLGDATASLKGTVYNPSDQLGFNLTISGFGGPNLLAPQNTYQSSKQLRYDGTWTKGSHSIKFGGELARILQGGDAPFYGKSLFSEEDYGNNLLSTCAIPAATAYGGDTGGGTCSGDPLYGYTPYVFVLGNGNGLFSERPGFGLSGGGQFSWRLAGYVADTWKVIPSLTIQAGLRWSADTDRANQDVATPTCGTLEEDANPATETGVNLQFTGCDASAANANKPLFDFYGPGLGLGQSTRQPWANFGPQVGFVFSPGSHKLSVRGGAGIYYENNLFNNGSNARSSVIQAQGKYFNYGAASEFSSRIVLPGYGIVNSITPAGTPCTTGAGCNPISYYFGESMHDAAIAFNGLKTIYDAASNVNAPNPSYIGTGGDLAAENIYAGPYKTPYSIQLNGGFQYEVKKGLVLSVDYLHNATLKIPATIDTNHTGAARTLNTTAATNAILATAQAADPATGYTTYKFPACAALTGTSAINCLITSGATIADFGGNGLDSLDDYFGGVPASAIFSPYGYSSAVAIANGAAFPGVNPNVGDGKFILPVGKSAYDALQIVLQQQKVHPMPFVTKSNFQVSYNLSRAISSSGGGSNQFFAGSSPYDQDCVNCYMGRNDLDQSNQLSISGSFSLKYGLQIGLVGHFFSANATSLTLANVTSIPVTGAALAQNIHEGACPAGSTATCYVTAPTIFSSDLDGDGQSGDLLPGQIPGTYSHSVKSSNLNQVIANYNATGAGKLTPAAQALISAGLFTAGQLTALGATTQPLAIGTAHPFSEPVTRTLDASFAYPITLNKFREGLTITPSVNMYNVTNMSNFSGFSGLLAQSGAGTPGGYLNGRGLATDYNQSRILRGLGNGTFDQGGPRTTEFGLKLAF